MQNFDGISFLWAVGLLAFIGVFYALRAILGFRAVAQDAQDDYDYKKECNMLDGRLSRDGYIRVFKRLHSPRRPAYVASAIFAIIVLTWPIMGALSFLLEQLYQFTGRSRVFEPGFLVWQFCIFFGIIFSWTSISYALARRYHRLAPGTPKYETDQQLQEEELGYRDKPVYETDWTLQSLLAGLGFFLFVIIIIWWKLS